MARETYCQMQLGIQITHIFSLIMVNFSPSAPQNFMFEEYLGSLLNVSIPRILCQETDLVLIRQGP